LSRVEHELPDLAPARESVLALLRALGFAGAARRVRRPLRTIAAAFVLDEPGLRASLLELSTSFSPAAARAAAAAVEDMDACTHHLLVFAEPAYARVVIACDGLHDGLRWAVLEPGGLRGSDVDMLREMVPAGGEGASARMIRVMRALDRSRVSDRFFRDVTAVRDAIASGWTGVPRNALADRNALALLLLSRMLFLYFLQQRGLLAHDRSYLIALLRAWLRQRHRSTFYRARLRPLFFGALNRRPAQRTAAARALGELPYLNGGLFELHTLERRCRALDLPDAGIRLLFEQLLEKYRFTSSDSDVGGGVDPEMLGRIFEGLMPGEERSRTGTFYTPAAVVQRVVAEVLHTHAPTDDELRALRVLDPACGSGAFLLGALSQLAELRVQRGIDSDIAAARSDVVARGLHGVDLLDDAALICALRLWLSLVPHAESIADIPPLPNLDRRIRQGDALIDPLDVADAFAGRPRERTTPRDLGADIRSLRAVELNYLAADPRCRAALRSELLALELRVARGWLHAVGGALEGEAQELAARAHDRDLFGGVPSYAAAAQRRLDAVRRRQQEVETLRSDVARRRTLPFFSFRVHFADTDGFDIVLSNPPWIRAHNWPATARRLLRERYSVCSDGGWPYVARAARTPAAAGGQVDLSLLFLEQSLRLLRDGGTLGMLLPGKLFRSLYAGGARALLLRTAPPTYLEDHSLHQRAIFGADAFTGVLVARRNAAPAPVRVCVTRGDGAQQRFELEPADLPFRSGDPHAPWLLAPPDVRTAFKAMSAHAPPLHEHGLRIRRGVMTRANHVLLLESHEAKLAGLSVVRAEGWARAGEQQRRFAAHVETCCVRPVLRGTDIRAFSAEPVRHMLWARCNDACGAASLPRLQRYLRRHRDALKQDDASLGTVHRVSRDTFSHKVVWSDLAADLRAAAAPAAAHVVGAGRAALVPLNTVYFVPLADERAALILAAYLNSLPVRTLARAIAERAKDAHFRFFAWCISVLPLPRDWQYGAHADALLRISRAAHAAHSIDARARDELDRVVADAFALTTAQLQAIARQDAWLSGRDAP